MPDLAQHMARRKCSANRGVSILVIISLTNHTISPHPNKERDMIVQPKHLYQEQHTSSLGKKSMSCKLRNQKFIKPKKMVISTMMEATQASYF